MMNCDWSDYGTKDSLLVKNYGIFNGKFRIGWIETNTDTALITENPPYAGEPNPDFPKFTLSVWNRLGVRAGLASLLGLPVFLESK